MEYGTGLQILADDNRDLVLGAVYGVISPEKLPKSDFDICPGSPILNQRRLDFCAAFASVSISGDQEGMELDPLWQFAQAKKIRGEYKSWGCDLRSIGVSFVKVGSIEKKDAPFDQNEHERNFLANWDNYPVELDTKAHAHKKSSVWRVNGEGDTFDNIRSALFQAFNARSLTEKTSLLAGTMWRYSWNKNKDGIIPVSGWEMDSGEGHAIKIRGQKTINGILYLVVQNSWGEDVGNHGIFYFPREVVNACFTPFGQFAFKDMSIEEARYLQNNGIKKGDNWLVAFAKTLYTLIIRPSRV